MKKEIVIKDIYSFNLSYTKGYSINSNIRYEMIFDKEKNKYIAKIKPYGVLEKDKKEIVVDNDKIIELGNILKKYHVEKWDGFNKLAKDVLDGDSFYLSVFMNDNNSIHASGYMIWPDGYKDFISKIDEFFMNIYNK